MNEFDPCPEPEVLAAFIDGRLAGEERRRVVEHLDACGDCYELFSATLRFQGEAESRGRLLGRGRFPAQRWVWAAAAAAVLLVLAALPLLRLGPDRLAPRPDAEGASLVADLTSSIEVADRTALARALRRALPGGELGFAPERPTRETTAFRAGTWLVEIRVAARVRDSGAASRALDALAQTLAAGGLGTKLEEPLAAAAVAAREGRFSELERDAVELEAALRELLEPSVLAFGAWAEAGRLAASVGDREFFRSDPFRSSGADAGAQRLAQGADASVAEIRALAGDGEVEPDELARLRSVLQDLVARY